MDECKTVHEALANRLGINLTVVDASERFLDLLKGVSDPEKKRKIIGNTFIEEAAKDIAAAAAGSLNKGKIE